MKSTNIKTVLGIDVGTTTIKAILISEKGDILGSSHLDTPVSVPKPLYEEIQHDILWERVLSVIKSCLKNANTHPRDVSCMGLSTLRSSFITWSKETGKPFHNIITWKDQRSHKLAEQCDKGFQLRLLRLISAPLYAITRSKMHQLRKNYHLDTTLCNVKLAWMLRNNKEVQKSAENNDLMFGTLDSWLLFKLNGGRTNNVHVTEPSNVISTGLWDMFTQAYSTQLLRYFDIPGTILPKIVDSSSPHDFGTFDCNIIQDILRTSDTIPNIPITAVMADQGASAYGLGCIKKGDMKLTFGTGTFFNMNTGKEPHCTFDGMWPLICWKQQGNLDFFVEGHVYATSASIEWGKHMGFYQDPYETSAIAYESNDIDMLCFIPAFHGLQEPFTDPRAGCGFIGLKKDHGTKEMTRAILESIAFGAKAIVDRVEEQLGYAKNTKEIKVDGGASKNDFMMELVAELTEKTILRMPSSDMSAIGVGLMAGIQANVWSNRDSLNPILLPNKIFKAISTMDEKRKLISRYQTWKKACKHFSGFYSRT